MGEPRTVLAGGTPGGGVEAVRLCLPFHLAILVYYILHNEPVGTEDSFLSSVRHSSKLLKLRGCCKNTKIYSQESSLRLAFEGNSS